MPKAFKYKVSSYANGLSGGARFFLKKKMNLNSIFRIFTTVPFDVVHSDAFITILV